MALTRNAGQGEEALPRNLLRGLCSLQHEDMILPCTMESETQLTIQLEANRRDVATGGDVLTLF